MKQILQKAVDQTLKKGADACDIIISSGEQTNMSSQNGKLDKFKLSKSNILGIRAIKNKKIGISYTESLDESAIEFAIKSAIENSVFSDINEFETISIKNSDELLLTSDSFDKSSMEEKIEFTLKLESEVKRKSSKVDAVPYNNLSISDSKQFYLNSHNTYTFEERNYLSAFTSALLKCNNITSMHVSATAGLELRLLNLDQCVDECLEHADNWLTAAPVATGIYDVIFEINVLNQIMNAFSSCFSAKDAIDKVNLWADKINQTVASFDFTLIDSPTVPNALFSYKFDSEGALKKDLALIENGVLKSFYHNTSTAKYFNTTTTGHAARDSKSSLNVTNTNLLIKPGLSKLSDIQDGSYLEIIAVMGMHSGCNSISGEFSFGASGYLCKDGKRIQAVKGITIAGNFNKLLCGILKIGDELKQNNSRSFFSPLIRFGHLAIAGN
jgi:PmbA protein